MIATTVTNVRRQSGLAGQFSLTADIAYPELPDEDHRVTFVGSTYGGPIFVIMADGQQIKVNDGVVERLGRTLDAKWIARFYGGVLK